MSSELLGKYEAEVARLDGEIAHYDRQWTKVPQFAWAALAAPIAGVVWGWGAGVVALLVALSLVGVRAYLIAMRKSEVVWMRDRVLQDIEDHAQPSRSRAGLVQATAHA